MSGLLEARSSMLRSKVLLVALFMLTSLPDPAEASSITCPTTGNPNRQATLTGAISCQTVGQVSVSNMVLWADPVDGPPTETAAVPEPATLALLGSGLLGGSMFLRRRAKRQRESFRVDLKP